MPSVVILDVEVSFPFEPYPAQVAYMRAVLEALNNGTNALLESPTGTGKTLCLLCATLAWLSSRRSAFPSPSPSSPDKLGGSPRVVYCSRTHAQLSQVIRELKRTSYGGTFSMALLGSREHMCVHPQVLRLPSAHAQQSMCNVLRDEKNCRFYRGFQSRIGSGSVGRALLEEQWVHDMEDLVTEGRKCGFCPYYWERDQTKEADIVFLPYNYVLDISLRKQLPFEMKGAILIVDEAHNLPSVLASSACVNLQPLELTNAIHDCSRALAMRKIVLEQKESSNAPQEGLMDEEELASLKIILCSLESCIAAEKQEPTLGNQNAPKHQIPPPPPPLPPAAQKQQEQEQQQIKISGRPANNSEELVREGSYMVTFLAKALITRQLFLGDSRQPGGMNEVMSKAIALLSQSEAAASGLATVQQFLSFVFDRDGDSGGGGGGDGDVEDSCRFVLQGGAQRSLGYWCLDASGVLATLTNGLRSLLLTSGTLSPLDHFAAELGLPFDVSLKGRHVIDPGQVFGSVLCRGPAGERLNGSYALRGGVDYRAGLGMALVNLARNVPGGMLVFFPSYAALNAATDLWRGGSGRPGDAVTVWAMLEELKPVFVEPSDASAMPSIVAGFQREVDSAPQRGAALIAVCRGKISEGVDFADNHGRCVVVVGIPFANHTDLFVRLKRDHITRVAPRRPKVRGRLFTGDDWYRNEAMRAVNQCLGRVIRHKDDYGAVVLADERFTDRLADLSEWVAECCVVHREFRETYAGAAQFFATHRRKHSHLNASATATGSVVPVAREGPSLDSKIPSSADAARRFAAVEEERRALAEREAQRQRIAGNVTPAAAPTPIHAMTPPVALPPPAFKKQSLPQTRAPPPAGTPSSLLLSSASSLPVVCHGHVVGATSKEFCLFLKGRLQPTRYDTFREKLRGIADLRNNPNLSSSGLKTTFSHIIDELAELFQEAAGEDDVNLLGLFGQHIPEEFRAYYAHLIRKRRRSNSCLNNNE